MQLENHKRAKVALVDIDRNPAAYLIIHYSCESFYRTEHGGTSRITSIAVKDLASSQEASFSIHKTAETLGIPYDKIPDSYDRIELRMLEEFFDYAEKHSNQTWIHLNMRGLNYGFAAIEHRYEILGKEPYKIPDEKKLDLGKLLKQYYGNGYANHPHMDNLVAMNGITSKDYLTGAQEADAFEKHEFNKLHMSTLRKVQVFESVIQLASDNKLKVNTKSYEWYGLTPQGLFELVKGAWWGWIVACLVSGIIGAFVGRII